MGTIYIPINMAQRITVKHHLFYSDTDSARDRWEQLELTKDITIFILSETYNTYKELFER